MKDSIVADPRQVSAFSVYKGLTPLKCYEDTSNQQPEAKRNKRRAKKSNGIVPRKGSTGHGELQCQSTSVRQAKKTNGTSGNSLKMYETLKNPEQQNQHPNKRKKQKKNKKPNKIVSTKDATKLKGEKNDHSMYMSVKELSSSSSSIVRNPLSITKVRRINDTQRNKDAVSPSASTSSVIATNKTTSKKSVGTNEIVGKTAKASSTSQKTQLNGFSSTKALKSKNLMQEGPVSTITASKNFATSSLYTVTSKMPPVDKNSVFTSSRIEDSVSHAKQVFEWLIHPVACEEFMKSNWEKKPLLIKRRHGEDTGYYKWILTTQTFDDILRRNPIKYGINLDITSFADGKRETLSENLQGRVRPAVVYDYYNNGCSIRMLNPQTYIQQLWRLNSSLQGRAANKLHGKVLMVPLKRLQANRVQTVQLPEKSFQQVTRVFKNRMKYARKIICNALTWNLLAALPGFVGANIYLTPPDSQGFAPHYDDIEAFVLQIEGKKRWKLYAARNDNEKLPRFSSRNFSEESDNLGEPILDEILEEGDLLYFPKGVIHQAQTVDGEHSLHITLSCNQLNSYGDLLKHHLNHALDKLIAEDIDFRKGLPTDYLSFMGIAHANTSDCELKKKRGDFKKKIEDLVTKIAKEPTDFASDAMGKKFIWDSLPPFLNSKERETTVVEDGEFMQNGKVFNRVEFGPETEVKFIRKNCVRLVVEEEQIKLYFSTENPLVYHEEDEPPYLEIPVELAPAVNHLISQYPNFTKIEVLPISSDDIGKAIQIVSDLWERGLIFTKEPLEPCDYDEFEAEDTEMNGDDDGNKGDSSDEDVESIDLSELPEEGENDTDSSDLNDDFYDTNMALDSVSSSDKEEDIDDDSFFRNGESEDINASDDSDDDNGIDIDGDFDFDELDQMSETDSD